MQEDCNTLASVAVASHLPPPPPPPLPHPLLLLQGAKGSVADKLRLALVQLLSAESPPSEAELGELTAALHAAGVVMGVWVCVCILLSSGRAKGGGV